MLASEYDRRVIELFKSGRATPAQEAELVEAVGCAFEQDTDKLKAIHKAIGFTAAQKVEFDEEDTRFLPERAAKDATALAACGSEKEKMQMIVSGIEATHRKAERAGDRTWGATLRKLRGAGVGTRRTRRAIRR